MAQVLTKDEDFIQDFQDVDNDVSTHATDPEYDAWFRRKVEAGEKAYREGRFVTQEEATRRAELRRQKLLGQVRNESCLD